MRPDYPEKSFSFTIMPMGPQQPTMGPQQGPKEFEIVYAPTRTEWVLSESEYVATDASGNPMFRDVKTGTNEFRIGLEFADPLMPGDRVDATVVYRGESPCFAWRFRPGSGFGPTADPMDDLHSQRLKLCKSDPAHCFFYGLDKATGIGYLHHADTTSAAMESNLSEIMTVMRHRVFQRSVVAGEPPIGLPRSSLVKEFSDLIWDEAEKAFTSNLMGQFRRALFDFGTGALRQEFPAFSGPTGPYVFAEANSYYLYFFGEFAKIAIDSGIRTRDWSEILETAIDMQRYYNKRAQREGHLEVMQYQTAPSRALDEKEIEELRLTTPVDALGSIQTNVRWLAEGFGDPGSYRPDALEP